MFSYFLIFKLYIRIGKVILNRIPTHQASLTQTVNKQKFWYANLVVFFLFSNFLILYKDWLRGIKQNYYSPLTELSLAVALEMPFTPDTTHLYSPMSSSLTSLITNFLFPFSRLYFLLWVITLLPLRHLIDSNETATPSQENVADWPKFASVLLGFLKIYGQAARWQNLFLVEWNVSRTGLESLILFIKQRRKHIRIKIDATGTFSILSIKKCHFLPAIYTKCEVMLQTMRHFLYNNKLPEESRHEY